MQKFMRTFVMLTCFSAVIYLGKMFVNTDYFKIKEIIVSGENGLLKEQKDEASKRRAMLWRSSAFFEQGRQSPVDQQSLEPEPGYFQWVHSNLRQLQPVSRLSQGNPRLRPARRRNLQSLHRWRGAREDFGQSQDGRNPIREIEKPGFWGLWSWAVVWKYTKRRMQGLHHARRVDNHPPGSREWVGTGGRSATGGMPAAH